MGRGGNKLWDYDPDGLLYVLEEDAQRIQEEALRVSLNPQFLQYDPVSDSGINVGYNSNGSSRVHGDPATPVWKAYSGDRVIFWMGCRVRDVGHFSCVETFDQVQM
ncbi:MAG: hypothetical protein PUD04_06275 [Firmicutes bacterium]|nr:hypothetical protein [Bacillota bacterium]